MCLTAETLALFLNLLDPDIITAEAGRITVNATERRAVWIQTGEDWCTDAPTVDRKARFSE